MSTSIDQAAIVRAARLLETGELVALPTETVYGLGADAENPAAIAKIYAAKGRPSNHPVIVHLASGADLSRWARDIPPEADRLAAAFWPGPLTMIVKRAPHIPDAVAGGQDTIGLRSPSHPVAQALLREFKAGQGGIAAPSANRFGHVSPTTAQHVRDEFGSIDLCILDGGQSEVGIESTILDLSRLATHGPVLLRPGQISAVQLADVLGAMPRAPDAAAPRASGTLESHYAPATPVALVTGEKLPQVVAQLAAVGQPVALMQLGPDDLMPVAARLAMPRDAAGYAHDLYAALRALDAAGAAIILVEAPPSDAAWQGVNDRLRRAAHDSVGVLDAKLGRAS